MSKLHNHVLFLLFQLRLHVFHLQRAFEKQIDILFYGHHVQAYISKLWCNFIYKQRNGFIFPLNSYNLDSPMSIRIRKAYNKKSFDNLLEQHSLGITMI